MNRLKSQRITAPPIDYRPKNEVDALNKLEKHIQTTEGSTTPEQASLEVSENESTLTDMPHADTLQVPIDKDGKRDIKKFKQKYLARQKKRMTGGVAANNPVIAATDSATGKTEMASVMDSTTGQETATEVKTTPFPMPLPMASAMDKPVMTETATESTTDKTETASASASVTEQEKVAGATTTPSPTISSGSEPASINNLSTVPSSAKITIIWKNPLDLFEHPDAGVVPNMPEDQFKIFADNMAANGFDARFYIHLLADGKTVWDGRQRLRASIQAKITTVPCVIDNVTDVVGEMIRHAFHRRHLTIDQQAFLSREWQKHLVAQRISERGKKGAAASHGCLLSDTDNKQPEKPNSRKEAARQFRVPENLLKGLMEIERYEKAHQVPANKSRRPAIRDGQMKIPEVLKIQAEADKSEKEQQRRENAITLPDLSDWRHGDALAVFRGLDESAYKASLVILDPDLDQGMESILKELRKIMLPDCGIFTFATFNTENMWSKVLENAGMPATARLLWDMGRSSGPIGQRHMSILWSAVGNAQIEKLRLSSDILTFPLAHCKVHPAEKPVELLRQLIQLATVPGELVLDPYGGIATTVIAARQTNRRVIAIEGNESYYLIGRERINKTFEASAQLDAEINTAITAEQVVIPSVQIDNDTTHTSLES